jgi:hypothetical protein
MFEQYKALKRERDAAAFSAMNNTKEYWRSEARATVEVLARKKSPFTTDEVLDILERKNTVTRENRALGGIMMKARNEGVIKPIGTRPTTRRCAHLRLKTLWIGA